MKKKFKVVQKKSSHPDVMVLFFTGRNADRSREEYLEKKRWLPKVKIEGEESRVGLNKY